jgi:hydroxypyruvate reductase
MDRRAARRLLLSCFEAALAAVDPERAVASSLSPQDVRGELVVLALGKAAPAMTRGAAQALGLEELNGVAVSNHPDDVPPGIELIIGGHPVPNERSYEAGRALLHEAHRLGQGDLAVVLISGGGSALAEVPVPGIEIADIAHTSLLLLRSGADIYQTNVVRRRLSQFKGGRLAEAIAPARLVTLVISDVVGDLAGVVASGPTIATTDEPGDALEVVRQLGIDGQLPEPVVAALVSPPHQISTRIFQELEVIAGGGLAAHAAADAAEERGYPATIVDTRLVGDAAVAAGEALERSRGSISVFAGETTVNVTGAGIGGRNHEAALVAATLIEGRSNVFFLAAGTDGIDGTTAAAGAIVDGTTLARSRALGLDAVEALDQNDSGTFFAELGDHIVTGPTGTNVGDIWLVLRTD